MLDERKRRILKAVIDDYIMNAEPVGSRTIEKKYSLGLSSATIRNEMADLEELGYLQQPHTSAGRVPSISGYRLYVDELMSQYSLTLEEISVLSEVMQDKLNYIDKIMAKASSLMSQLTNCTSVVIKPSIQSDFIKNIRLIEVNPNVALTVIVTDSGLVRDEKIVFSQPVTANELLRLENAINHHLTNVDFSEITMERIITIVNEANVSNDLVVNVFKLIQDVVNNHDSDVLVNGQTNIFGFPEFQNMEKARKYLSFVGDRGNVLKAFNEVTDDSGDVSVKIGNLNGEDNYSIITTKYKMGNNTEGVIGLIGPVRMDYKKAVSVMKYVSQMLNNKTEEIEQKRGMRENE